MKNQLKNIFLGIVAIALLFVGYVYFLKPQSDQGLVVSSSGMQVDEQGQPLAGEELVVTLAKMDQVKIDQTFFTSNQYQSLRDFGIDISTWPVGKTDPFAFLNGQAQVSVSTTTLDISKPAAKSATKTPAKTATPVKK